MKKRRILKITLWALGGTVLITGLTVFLLLRYSIVGVYFNKYLEIQRSQMSFGKEPDYPKRVLLTTLESENGPVRVWGNDQLCASFAEKNMNLIEKLAYPCKISNEIYSRYSLNHIGPDNRLIEVEFAPRSVFSMSADVLENGRIIRLYVRNKCNDVKITDENINLVKRIELETSDGETMCDYWANSLFPEDFQRLKGFPSFFEVYEPRPQRCFPSTSDTRWKKRWYRVIDGYVVIDGGRYSEFFEIELDYYGQLCACINTMTNRDYRKGDFTDVDSVLNRSEEAIRLLLRRRFHKNLTEKDFDFELIEYLGSAIIEVYQNDAVLCATNMNEVRHAKELAGNLIYCHLVRIPAMKKVPPSSETVNRRDWIISVDSVYGQVVGFPYGGRPYILELIKIFQGDADAK